MIAWPDWAAVGAAAGDDAAGASCAAEYETLRRAVLKASASQLEEQAEHAAAALGLLVRVAATKGAHRSDIAQVVRKLMRAPSWERAYGQLPRLRSQVQELHEDLRLAFGHRPSKPEQPAAGSEAVLDPQHCCICLKCAKNFTFKCPQKYTIPHYCAKHFHGGGGQAPSSSRSRRPTFRAPPPPPGFNSEEGLAGGKDGKDSGGFSSSRVLFSNTVPHQVRDLVASSANDERFAKELGDLGVALPPEKVTEEVLQRGLQLAKQVQDALDQGRGDLAAQPAAEFQRLVCGDGPPPAPSREQADRQVEIIDLLYAVADYNRILSGGFDLVAEHCDLGLLEPETEEGRLLRRMLMQTANPDETTLTRVETFRLSRHEEEAHEQGWEKIIPPNNRVLLWHGTRASRLVSILQHGLSLVDRRGWQRMQPAGTFGHGLYFADMAAKSLQYCDGAPGEAVLLVSEVCLGSMYCLTGGRLAPCFDWRARDSSKRRGCHSTWGVGRTWPDPSSFAHGSPDSVVPNCDVPLGPPAEVRCVDGSLPGLPYNEFVVYNGAQVRLRYLVRVQLGPPPVPRAVAPAQGESSSPQGGGGGGGAMSTAPRVWFPAVPNYVVQTPYCIFAKAAGADQLQHAVRWQYLFEESRLLDSTPCGWVNYGEAETKKLEDNFWELQDGPASCLSRISSGGYEYDVDLRRMEQTNVKTGKTRRVRRTEFAFRREVIEGGGEHLACVDVARHEEVHWAWEVQGNEKLKFAASFEPRAGAESKKQFAKAWCTANAWNFTAPEAGTVELSWTNNRMFGGAVGSWSGRMSAPRALLLDYRKEPAAAVAARVEERDRGEERGRCEEARRREEAQPRREEQQRRHEEQDDSEAAAAMEATNREADALLRDHLEDHLRRNPGATFKTWIADMVPENVSLDPRLEHESSAWLRIFRELSSRPRPEQLDDFLAGAGEALADGGAAAPQAHVPAAIGGAAGADDVPTTCAPLGSFKAGDDADRPGGVPGGGGASSEVYEADWTLRRAREQPGPRATP